MYTWLLILLHRQLKEKEKQIFNANEFNDFWEWGKKENKTKKSIFTDAVVIVYYNYMVNIFCMY